MAISSTEITDKQHRLDQRYMRMALVWAENSYCVRRQVGALLVKDKMIISDGYNGTPSGFENVCEDETNRTKPYVLHAEANAITKVARSYNTVTGPPCITASPCIECAKLIIQAGIRRVVYEPIIWTMDFSCWNEPVSRLSIAIKKHLMKLVKKNKFWLPLIMAAVWW